MSKKALRVPDYLDHMQEAIARILRFTQGKSFRTFCSDEQLQDAVIRNIEIIGEAANNIQKHAPDYVHAHPDIPWSALYAMRNRVAHGYWTVDLELVWQVTQSDILELQDRLADLLTAHKDNPPQ